MTSTYSSDCFINWKGKTFDGRYILLNKLGHGSYSSVWMAYDFQDLKYCAIKITNCEDYKMGVKEGKIYDALKQYKCSRIITLSRTFEHKTDEGNHFCCVMELMAESLYSILKINNYKNGIDFCTVMKFTKQILGGLVILHKNKIIHGDIKPENILIDGISESQKKIMDKINIDKIIKNNSNGKFSIKNKGTLSKIIAEINKKIASDSDNKESSDSSDDESDSDNESDESDSDDSDNGQISISSSDEDEDEDEEKINNKIFSEDNDKILKNTNIKLADMGNCILQNKRKKKHIQTCYYRSPEVLLKNEYDESCDMWALGCTIYELLAGRILFDADDYEGNTTRHHIYLIIERLGSFPKHIISASPNKDIYFSVDFSRVKGYKKINFFPLEKELEDIAIKNELNVNSTKLFIDFMLGLLKYDKSNRLTAKEAISHKIFDHV